MEYDYALLDLRVRSELEKRGLQLPLMSPFPIVRRQVPSSRIMRPAYRDFGTSMMFWLEEPRKIRLKSFFSSINLPSTSTSI